MARFKEIDIIDFKTGEYIGTSYRLESDDKTPQALYEIVRDLCKKNKPVTLKRIDKKLRKKGLHSWTGNKHEKNPYN